jgi:hypothetical protein
MVLVNTGLWQPEKDRVRIRKHGAEDYEEISQNHIVSLGQDGS